MRIRKRQVFFGFAVGYLITFVGMTIEELVHGLEYIDVLFSWHHYLYPCVTGFVGSWYMYWKEKEKILHKIQREALKKEKGRWEDLVRQSAVGFFVSTPEGKVKFANSALLMIFGQDSLEEFEKIHLPQICTPELLTDGKYISSLSLTTKDGRKIKVSYSIIGNYDDNKNLLSIMGSLNENKVSLPNKQLIISVCAYCKKMIQKNNQWFPAVDALMFFEEEIKEHEGNIAQSHGMCPECAESMFKTMKEIKNK
jgi:PAS domain-containing protein